MRLGQSDRQIAKSGLMGRAKAGVLRALALAKGWLDFDRPLPSDEEIAAVSGTPSEPAAPNVFQAKRSLSRYFCKHSDSI